MTHGLKAVFRLVLLAAAATSVYAEKYALIAGVGQFVYLGDKNSLAGARPDAEKTVAILSKYGFRRDNMTVLIGKEGTRDAFLGGIDHIADLVKEGDQVVIYFSGHGTSSMDGNGGFGMDADTGAVIPSDLKPGDKEEVLAQLILGKRDLRPRLGRLEQKASVLVIFDACFSGESVKAISVGGQSRKRYISLADLTNGDVSSKSIMAAERSGSRAAHDFPYQRVVYLSAASKSQPAWDIAPHGDFTTFDGLPHGAFTNVFLKLLSEGAGSGEGCRTLYDQAVKLVHEQATILKVDQDPQLLYSSSDSAQVERPCLAPNTQTHEEPPGAPTQPTPAPTQPTPANDIRAQMDRVAAAAAFRLQCAPSKPSYRAGENTVLTCNLPESGYLQIFSYGMGDPHALVVFPNERHQENSVSAGSLKVPNGSEFSIENYLPDGITHQEQVMLVIFSKARLDARSLGVPEGIFTGFPPKAFRSQRVTGPEGYGAAELVFEIH